MLAILGRFIDRRTMQFWKQKDNPPIWAARATMDYIRGRCEVGLRLADQLQAYIEAREAAVAARRQQGQLIRDGRRRIVDD